LSLNAIVAIIYAALSALRRADRILQKKNAGGDLHLRRESNIEAIR
jgi:hypothetical protein